MNYIQEAPAVLIVNQLLLDALHERASDIHIEPCEENIRIRFRVDGVLHERQSIDNAMRAMITARIKVLGYLNTTEYRVPQDGKFLYTYAGGKVDIRISTFPVLHGEKIMLRLLARTDHIRTVHELGASTRFVERLHHILSKDRGFLLVTGPTGSGKTTTLYALLQGLDRSGLNIVTLEQPIEYTIPGIMQSNINYEVGFTFEKGLRSLLRQDPDVIFIGEIRDKETAQVALQASLTGHLVMSTLHTHDAPSALTRLLDMSIEPYLIAAGISGIVSQRLVRLLCEECKREVPVSPSLHLLSEEWSFPLTTVFEGVGCQICSGRGTRGRTGVFEFLKMTPMIREMVHNRVSHRELYQQLVQEEYRSFMHDVFACVQSGQISGSELIKFCG